MAIQDRPAAASTVDPREVAQFAGLAGRWWDEAGEMRMLHRLNPVRLKYIRDQALAVFGRDSRRLDALAGLRVLDIGCGGGILSEPLARMGGEVVGIDPAAANIEAARRHAEASGLSIDYRATTAEALADAGERFDIVLAMEVVEHVADVDLFVRRAGEMVKPGGLAVFATINRTLKSFALAIVAAEYLLGWLPRGTHSWDKLVTGEELESALTRAGVAVRDETGVVYDLVSGAWRLSADMDVNYMVAATRPAFPATGN
ncbi:MAG TPA: bifunctional 2-polyprenyl-6-hydroxyphenol methylase/3-demethylubiquinol 3-O-methyltransferase UbiG [Xanthobacteraceae bacterium]